MNSCSIRTRKSRVYHPRRRLRDVELHVIRRARKRFKIELNRDDVRHLANMVKRGQAKFLYRKSTLKTAHLVSFKGKDIVVLYDKNRSIVRTVLTVPMFEKWKKMRISQLFSKMSIL